MNPVIVTLANGQRYEQNGIRGCWHAINPQGAAWPGCMSPQAFVREVEQMTVQHSKVIRSGPTRAERKRAKKVAA